MIDLDDPADRLLSIPHAVAWLADHGATGITARSVWRWISRGVRRNGRPIVLASCKLGAHRYTSVRAIKQYIAEQSAPVEPKAKPESSPARRPGDRFDPATQAALDALR